MRLRRTAGAEDLRALAEREIHKTRTRKRVTPHNKYPLTHTRISNPNLNLNLNPNPSLNLPTSHKESDMIHFSAPLESQFSQFAVYGCIRPGPKRFHFHLSVSNFSL